MQLEGGTKDFNGFSVIELVNEKALNGTDFAGVLAKDKVSSPEKLHAKLNLYEDLKSPKMFEEDNYCSSAKTRSSSFDIPSCQKEELVKRNINFPLDFRRLKTGRRNRHSANLQHGSQSMDCII